MLYCSEPLEFISATSTTNNGYTNYRVNVKSRDGYLNALDCTKGLFEELDAAQRDGSIRMGVEMQFRVLSYTKKHNRKDGSGSFTMHHELATAVNMSPVWVFGGEE